ncbi:MAG: GrpB family protein [Acidiphilium sp.]
MSPPFKVELLPHDPQWARQAADVGKTLAAAVDADFRFVHHIGSTAIPGIRAKPVLDLMPVVADLAELDARRDKIEALGYAWWGEFGLPGRRYCTMDDPRSGRRLVQLHCYAENSPEIVRHLAFRDYLRANADIAEAYEREKLRCRCLHAANSHAYADCKHDWISKVEAEALVHYRS